MAATYACRCPVCNGKGIVPNGWYSTTNNEWTSTSTTPDQCRSCGGTGVLWTEDASDRFIELDQQMLDEGGA